MRYAVQQMIRIVLALTASIAVAFSQTGTSSITGTVSDSTGSAIPGVGITVINQESGARVETATNEVGVYRVPSLPPGVYRIAGGLPGVNKLTRGPIPLLVSRTLALAVQFEVGQISETVGVTGAGPLDESAHLGLGPG